MIYGFTVDVVAASIGASRIPAKVMRHGQLSCTLERAKVDKPHVCLIDIGLPGLDGNQVARRQRSSSATDNAILIAVTRYGQDADREDARAAGFNHHLVKPVDTRRRLQY